MTTPSDGQPKPPPLPPRRQAGTDWRRQHPAACFFNTLRTVRTMIFPIVAGVLAARGIFLLVFLGTILAMSLGIALLRYWRYRYRFTEDELVVEQGWLFRNTRHVAYVRIQNVNITRNVFHRLFGVSGVQLESASGSEPEAVMEALSKAAIDELHARIGEQRREDRDQMSEVRDQGPEGRREVLRLGLGELVRHGAISNRGAVLVGAAIGYLLQGPLGDRFFPMLLSWLERFTERPPTEILEAMGPAAWFFMGLAVVVAIVLGLVLLSVIYAIVRYYGFTLSVDAKSVRAEYGLFTRVTITVPKRRIQLIGFHANPFHRLCRRLSVRVETAGLTGASESASSLRWLAPILPEREAPRVLAEAQPEVEWDAFEWKPLHPRTRVRMLRVRLIQLAVVTVLLVFLTGVTGLLALLLVPAIFAYVRGYCRYAAWAAGPTAIAFRSGWLVRQQSVVRYPKIQTVSLTRNPFDPRWGMATVNIDTAGADPTGHSVHIRFLDYDAARKLTDFLEEKTRQTAFVW